MTAKKIYYVKAADPQNRRTVAWDADKNQPNGEVFISANGRAVAVVKTAFIQKKIDDGDLVVVSEEEAEDANEAADAASAEKAAEEAAASAAPANTDDAETDDAETDDAETEEAAVEPETEEAAVEPETDDAENVPESTKSDDATPVAAEQLASTDSGDEGADSDARPEVSDKDTPGDADQAGAAGPILTSADLPATPPARRGRPPRMPE